MAQSTIYDVILNYQVGGNAHQGLKDVGAAAQHAESGLGGLKGAIGEVVAALGLVKGFELGKKAFIDFNSMLEQSTVSIAAQEKMLKGGKWDDAMKNATDLVGYYQQQAKASINTTEEWIQMHRGIAGAGYRIGMSNDEIKQMTKGAILLSSAFGESAQYVSLEVKEMLSGVVNARQRIPAILLASQNKTREEYAKMDAKAKRNLVLTALKDPALMQAAKAVEFSWKGVTSTLKDNLQIAAGKVGLPLFKAISNEVKGWNTWIEDNGQKLEQYGKAFGDWLISAFQTSKEILKELEPLGRLIKNNLSDVTEFYKENQSWLKGPLGGWTLKAIKGVATGLDRAAHGSEQFQETSALTEDWKIARQKELAAVGGQASAEKMAKYLPTAAKEQIIGSAKSEADRARQEQIETQKRMLDAATKYGYVSKAEGEGGKPIYSVKETKEDVYNQLQLAEETKQLDKQEIEARREFIKALYDDIFGLQRSLSYVETTKKEDERAKKLSPEHHKVNVNIHKIEVASPDPDRFVFGMVRSFRAVAENPVTAASTLRGGF